MVKRTNQDDFFERYGNHLNRDPFDKKFDRTFDRHEERIEKMLDNPGKSFFKFAGVALLLNLVFWGFIILMVVLGLKWIL